MHIVHAGHGESVHDRRGRLEVAANEGSASAARLDTLRSKSVDVGGIGFARGFANHWALGATLDAWSGLGLTTGPVTGETSPGGFGGGALAPHLSGWLELVSIVDREPGYPWLTTVNGGLSDDIRKHVGLSLGVAAGHTHETTDHGVFGGVGLHL